MLPPAEHNIRIATKQDSLKVSDILASAFADDPVANWVCPDPMLYASFFRLEAQAIYLKHHHVYINQENTGAAMWLPSGVSAGLPLHWRLPSVLLKASVKAGTSTLKRMYQLDEFFCQYHIKEPHFYLRSVGASAGNQGRGIGSSLLKTGLRDCDHKGAVAFLESTNEANNPLYERFGFDVIKEASLPDGGPTVWFMKREAR